MSFYLLPALAVILSLTLVYLVKTQLQNVLVDIPNDRSSHTQPTPRGGGLGFIIAFVITSWLSCLLPTSQVNTPIELAWLWLILTPLATIGICDDRWSLPSTWRYLVQLLTATIAVLHYAPFPQPWLESWGDVGDILAVILTIVGMTAIVNFYNFMDGLDGLVGGVAAIQIAFIALYAQQPILWLLVAAIAGFLYWNWSPAKIFMGDAGSTFLGATIAIALLNQPHNPVHSWTSLAITCPLLIDAIYTLTRRLIKRENIFQAHRSHLYQRLQQSGLNHSTVASIYIIATTAIALLILNYGYIGAIAGTVVTIIAIGVGEIYLSKNTSLKIGKNV
jgi:UDP-N-acetylmuramyl pentapeptide phosphotransferase/UDP-N-acetylglucosamine-1-phosphate transferase